MTCSVYGMQAGSLCRAISRSHTRTALTANSHSWSINCRACYCSKPGHCAARNLWQHVNSSWLISSDRTVSRWTPRSLTKLDLFSTFRHVQGRERQAALIRSMSEQTQTADHCKIDGECHCSCESRAAVHAPCAPLCSQLRLTVSAQPSTADACRQHAGRWRANTAQCCSPICNDCNSDRSHQDQSRQKQAGAACTAFGWSSAGG